MRSFIDASHCPYIQAFRTQATRAVSNAIHTYTRSVLHARDFNRSSGDDVVGSDGLRTRTDVDRAVTTADKAPTANIDDDLCEGFQEHARQTRRGDTPPIVKAPTPPIEETMT